MREPGRRDAHGVARWRSVAALLTAAALLSLGLGQPLHTAAPIGAASSDTDSTQLAAASPAAAQHAEHDADLCSLCRATAQARLGLRACAGAFDLAAVGACLPLPLPAPELAACAPELRDAPPRAPPSLLPAIS